MERGGEESVHIHVYGLCGVSEKRGAYCSVEPESRGCSPEVGPLEGSLFALVIK